jgi:hypothetical protein
LRIAWVCLLLLSACALHNPPNDYRERVEIPSVVLDYYVNASSSINYLPTLDVCWLGTRQFFIIRDNTIFGTTNRYYDQNGTFLGANHYTDTDLQPEPPIAEITRENCIELHRVKSPG